jgi:hypothetical protein
MRTSELGRFRSAVAVVGGLAALTLFACFPQARAILFVASLAIGLFAVVAVLPIVAVALLLRAVGADPSQPRRPGAGRGGQGSGGRVRPTAFSLGSVSAPRRRAV